MSATFKPKYVPSDVIARWPAMAFALWKRSFTQQAGILLAAALLIKFLPAWSAVLGFLIAPSLFVVSFVAVQIADEHTVFSWKKLVDTAMPGALRLGFTSIQFAACFGLGIAALSWFASLLLPTPSLEKQVGLFGDGPTAPAAVQSAIGDSSNVVVEFLHFCATWTEGVMTMVFLGMFVVAIYQGIFGVVLHAQQGFCTRTSRNIGWLAWQTNSESIEQALREAPPKFFQYLALIVVIIICGFQTVYLSPIGLLFATYIPCLAYVAYRSIFFGKHENIAAAKRAVVEQSTMLEPALQRY